MAMHINGPSSAEMCLWSGLYDVMGCWVLSLFVEFWDVCHHFWVIMVCSKKCIFWACLCEFGVVMVTWLRSLECSLSVERRNACSLRVYVNLVWSWQLDSANVHHSFIHHVVLVAEYLTIMGMSANGPCMSAGHPLRRCLCDLFCMTCHWLSSSVIGCWFVRCVSLLLSARRFLKI